MKEYNTINKKPYDNKFTLQKLNIPIQGKIIYVTTTPSPNKKTFILTDKSVFYVIENNNFTKAKEYPLQSEILRTGKINGKPINFQTTTLESQIWSDKKGNHVIIKYKNVCFYYNPYMAKQVEELQLIPPGNTLIQPYAVVFNEDKVEKENTGIVLLSDYKSSIFELQLFLSDKKEMMRFRFGEVLRLKPESNKRKTLADYEFRFFEMDKDDRILDFQLFKEKDKFLLIAITKKILFQFEGKKDFNGLFNNYLLENGNIIKAVKKFLPKSKEKKVIYKLHHGERKEITRIESEERETYQYSRIQLLNNDNDEEKKEKEKEKEKNFASFGFMSDCGYITLDVNNDLKPQTKFNILKYYKISIESKDKGQYVHQLMPKAVCETKFNIFFLYSDYLVVQSKLTNGIKFDEYIPYKFIDMFYNEDSIIIYNENNLYKISLENEYYNLYEDYIEKGDYKAALEIKKDDKYLMPKLHKIYADYLFNNKQYLKAALEYAFSNEIFENVCIKFLNINNISGLIRYMILILKFRLYNSSSFEKENKEEKKVNPREQFIDKYLIKTWLLELLIEKYEDDKDDKLCEKIREIARSERDGSQYIDQNLLYYILNIYNKQEELIEIAGLKKDHETIITSLINRNKIDETLYQFKLSITGEGNELDIKLKNYFYKYGNLLIKENTKNTIELLNDYYKPEKPDEIIRVLISPNFDKLSQEENNFRLIINYLKDIIKKPYKIGGREINITKNKILHNLYILLVSYSKNEKYKSVLFSELKTVINTYIDNLQIGKKGEITDKIYFDLNFAKKIFTEKEDEKSKGILCLLYYLLNQYIDSIDIAIENNFQDLIVFLTENIPEEKLKKKIWLKIFQHEKETKGLSSAKEVVSQSANMIKIEDIIPLMGDDEKLIEFKEELTNSISNSEKSYLKLNKEILEFNESNDLIIKDIELSEKKAIKKKYTDLRCCKCDKNINTGRNTKFFLFPCQHIFDLQCLIDTYIEFNLLNIGDGKKKKDFEVKITVIKDLASKIRNLELKKSKALEGKEKFMNEEEYVLNDTKKMLYNYLDEECLLCGQEMIDSTQIEFGSEDKFEWDLI